MLAQVWQLYQDTPPNTFLVVRHPFTRLVSTYREKDGNHQTISLKRTADLTVVTIAILNFTLLNLVNLNRYPRARNSLVNLWHLSISFLIANLTKLAK